MRGHKNGRWPVDCCRCRLEGPRAARRSVNGQGWQDAADAANPRRGRFIADSIGRIPWSDDRFAPTPARWRIQAGRCRGKDAAAHLHRQRPFDPAPCKEARRDGVFFEDATDARCCARRTDAPRHVPRQVGSTQEEDGNHDRQARPSGTGSGESQVTRSPQRSPESSPALMRTVPAR